jgi:hypothetical protein
VAGSYGSTHDGKVSFPFACCDDGMNKPCAGDISATAVHEEEEEPGQTCLGETHSQNTWQQDGMLQEVHWLWWLHESCGHLVWKGVEGCVPLACSLQQVY